MRIAVVGSGITGLSAAWLLSRSHDVTLYEQDNRIGGHSNTVEVEEPSGVVPIDTGFIVYNTKSYPNLIALFDYLSVPTAPTEMSFAVSLNGGAFEYSGNGLPGLFGQRRNLLNPAHWKMASDILRFFSQASAIDAAQHDPHQTLGEWLNANGYGEKFTRRHILPMAAAIWSAPANEILAFPAAAFIRFFANHGLLQVADRPQWRTVEGGSREYVGRILQDYSGKIASNDAVTSVKREAGGVVVTTRSGSSERFDQCVLACHADQTIALIDNPTPEEQSLLSKFGYFANEAWLHTDAAQMPRRNRLWTSWNYLGDRDAQSVAVTYWMNRLQPLQTSNDYFVTLNPITPIDPDKVVSRFNYEHPRFDIAAMTAQRDLWSLQGRDRLWFAGSYFGYGFHEDGLQSGLAVAEDLGGTRRPWSVDGERDRILADGAAAGPEAMAVAAQ